MPKESFARELKSEIIEVKSLQRLTAMTISNGRFSAEYTETKYLPDGSEFTSRKFTVERAEDVAGQAANDGALAFYQQFEVWRQEDDAKRAADAALEAAAVDPVTGAALPLGP